MGKLFVMVTIMAFLLLSLNAQAQPDQKSAGSPPISQTLVPEGDFALKLATALKVGTPTDEAQAEDMLTSAGIAPKNGWIADYPVTPNIIGDLQNAVATSADSKKLPMGKDEALKAFQGITTEFGVAVAPGSGQYAESQPLTSSEYVQPQEINNYYYQEGPPVVTYYPPPWDYYYLYGWVPYPFWRSGFFFPGFFVLNDFDFVFVGHHHHHHRITNHFFDHRTHAFGRVDPVRHSWTNSSRTTAFNSTATRNAASSIFNRSMQRTTFAQGSQGMTGNRASAFNGTQGRQGVVANNRGNTVGGRTLSNSNSFATGSRMDRGTQGITGNRASTFNGTQGRQGVVANNRGNTVGGRTLSNSNSFATGSGMDHRSSQSFSRSFSAPSSRGSSSFGRGSGHSFSGLSGGHASGGFSGGHSSGGFSGGGHGGGGGRR